MEAGLPPLVLQTLTGHGAEIGDALVADERVRMISFTGGVEAGQRITTLAGLKKIGMELGSNSPVIVMEGCRPPLGGRDLRVGRVLGGRAELHRRAAHLRPQDVYGAFRDGVRRAHQEVQDRRQAGRRDRHGSDDHRGRGEARRALGARRPSRPGATVLDRRRRATARSCSRRCSRTCPKTRRIHREEVFGPTVNLYPVDDARGGARARPTRCTYGLHAAIFTRDVDTAFKLALRPRLRRRHDQRLHRLPPRLDAVRRHQELAASAARGSSSRCRR